MDDSGGWGVHNVGMSAGVPNQSPRVAGVCSAMFAFDIALGIDLDLAERLLAGAAPARESIRRARRAPRSFDYHPKPLRITQAGESVEVAGLRSRGAVDVTFFDFGAVSVEHTFEFDGPLEGLLALGDGLYEHEGLLADARRRVVELMGSLGPALREPGMSDLSEDYAVYHVRSCGERPEELIDRHSATLAGVLRAEAGPLSRQEIDDALATRISYGPDDVAIIDWNASILFDPSDAADQVALLEFANIELLEMRHLDDRLDAALERASLAVEQRPWAIRLFARGGQHLRAVAGVQVDAALLFEGVNNALKIVGDQYLARFSRAGAARLHLPDWEASILRKLATLESVYDKLADREATRRMELLEWIIIVLIAVSAVLPFVV